MDAAYARLDSLTVKYPRLAKRLFEDARKSLDIIAAVDQTERLIAIHDRPSVGISDEKKT